jgi:hypothetical protein
MKSGISTVKTQMVTMGNIQNLDLCYYCVNMAKANCIYQQYLYTPYVWVGRTISYPNYFWKYQQTSKCYHSHLAPIKIYLQKFSMIVFLWCSYIDVCFACWALTNMTFRGPCIVIYSYNKSQRDVLFLNFIWYRTLHVLDRFTVHH